MLMVYKATVVKGWAEVKINNKSNYIHEVLLTVLPGAFQESNYTSSQTLCGLYDELSPFFKYLSSPFLSLAPVCGSESCIHA